MSSPFAFEKYRENTSLSSLSWWVQSLVPNLLSTITCITIQNCILYISLVNFFSQSHKQEKLYLVLSYLRDLRSKQY